MDDLVGKLLRIWRMNAAERLKMGLSGREIIRGWDAETFAKGFLASAECARRGPQKRAGIFSRMMLGALCAKQLG
jgi:hypothetical protein